jgi:metallo-beta-lactamase class B
MEKRSIRKSLCILLMLISGMFLLQACNATPVESEALDTEAITPDEVSSTQTLESDFNINDWDEVSLSKDLTLHNIGEGVIEVTHRFPWAANSVLVEMPDKTFVWAGSTYTPEAAALVLRWLEQNYGEVEVVGIVTGYHVDNLGGSAALIERGYAVYGSDRTVDLLAEKGEAFRDYMIELSRESGQDFYSGYHKNIPYLAPTHVFSIKEGITLEFGGETVRVYYPGHTQTDDKLVVVFPEKKILFGSCMLLGGEEVGNTREADILSWIQSVTRLKQWDAEIVIPGHGEGIGPDLIDHTVELLENDEQ